MRRTERKGKQRARERQERRTERVKRKRKEEEEKREKKRKKKTKRGREKKREGEKKKGEERDIMIGIIAAVKGMLSIAADIIAATHMRIMHASKKSSFTKGMMNVPRYSKNPLPSTPPTIINKAMKNISNGISTSCMMSSSSKCFCRKTRAIKPAPATIHGSQWMIL